MKQKDPLYRKVNSKARQCRHNTGPDSANSRGTKSGITRKMTHIKRGLDYTPLFKFLLSKVGQRWDDVYSDIKDRILPDAPVHYMVKMDTNYESIFRYGESTYFSRLYVDNDGILQKIDNGVRIEHLHPSCPCCTHTFNGIRFTNKYEYSKSIMNALSNQ